MKIKIPYDLRIKFLSLEGLDGNMDMCEIKTMGGRSVHVPTTIHYNLELNLSESPHLLKFCQEWMQMIEEKFQEDYIPFKIDIGPYTGLWPTHTTDGTVHFRMDVVDPGKKNWKDWFVLGDMEYASK